LLVSADPVVLAASRRTGDGTNTIVEPPEVRRIVVARGLQATRADNLRSIERTEHDTTLSDESRAAQLTYLRGVVFPDGLPTRIPGTFVYELDGKYRALYLNPVQNVLYSLELVEDKRSFLAALRSEGTIVIYAGHARYGRGPCFGPSDAPGDDWESGTEPETRGLYRMAYPYVGIPVHEILDHGYHTRGVLASEPRPTRADAEPDLRPHLGQLQPRRVTQMHPDPAMTDRLAAQLGVTTDGDEMFWTYRAVEDQAHGTEVHVVLWAGWHDTPSAPADLGATGFECRMFCHFGCSSFQHHYHVVRMLKGWKRDGDSRFAYWTTDLSNVRVGNVWLTHLMTYPHRHDGRPWGPWLEYAVRETNRELRAQGERYQLI
jgi:hypothetical protein